jgi:hypothetical protein
MKAAVDSRVPFIFQLPAISRRRAWDIGDNPDFSDGRVFSTAGAVTHSVIAAAAARSYYSRPNSMEMRGPGREQESNRYATSLTQANRLDRRQGAVRAPRP